MANQPGLEQKQDCIRVELHIVLLEVAVISFRPVLRRKGVGDSELGYAEGRIHGPLWRSDLQRSLRKSAADLEAGRA